MWTDPIMKFIYISTAPRRIIGVVADMDDTHLVPEPEQTIYHPFGQIPDVSADKDVSLFGGRLFVHTRVDPHGLITPITQIIRRMAVDQPVERAATLEEVRGSAYPGPSEYVRIWRVRRSRPDHRCCGCRRRAGLLGKRTYAQVRHSPGGRSATTSLAAWRDRRGDRHVHLGRACGRAHRVWTHEARSPLLPFFASTERIADRCVGHFADGPYYNRLDVSGRTRRESRCERSAKNGVGWRWAL